MMSSSLSWCFLPQLLVARGLYYLVSSNALAFAWMHAGLNRCGKSCRLRWANYLRPDIRRGPFTAEEQKSVVQLHAIVGNK
jgi:hypothetical protein